MLEALVLVGGRGTRLGAAAGGRPKPLVPVAGRPFLEWTLLQLAGQGVGRVVLCSGHGHAAMEELFGRGRRFGLEVVLSREPAPLGTGGALRHALPATRGPRLLALNGDVYFRLALARLVAEHERARARAALWVVRVPDAGRFGEVTVAPDGSITRFAEKTGRDEPGLINAGAYLLERDLLAQLPPDRPVSIEREVFPTLAGGGLHAVVGDGPFVDIGTPASLAAAEDVLRAEIADGHLPG
jgi:NDP-sugar pyrophosphorylase family protein